jgi:hypothetical protein
MSSSPEYFMNFGVYEGNLGEQQRWSADKVQHVSDHRARVERLGGGAWTDDAYRTATDAVRQHENRVVENAGRQSELARRGHSALQAGQNLAQYSQGVVNALLGS